MPDKMTGKRPRFDLPLSQTDKVIEILAAGLMAVLFIYTFVSWSNLPETIPVHFDAKGQPDGYGGRITIFFSPLLTLALFVLLTVLNRRPDIFNYPVRISPENAEYHYRLATKMLRLLKLSLVIMFGAITWSVVHSARSGNSDYVMWVLPFALIITFIPIIYYFFSVFKRNSSNTLAKPKNQKERKYKLY